MRRERAPDELAREIAKLRATGPLPEKYSERAAILAGLWMEQDARRIVLGDAPEEARQAVCHEYMVTNFRPGERWPVKQPSASAGAWEG